MWVGPESDRIDGFVRRGREGFFSLFAQRGCVTTDTSQKKAQNEAYPAGSLILDFEPPEL